MTPTEAAIKRAMDVAASAALLWAISPALAVIAAAIKMDSEGPVLFRQKRLGRHGETFEIIKFRTMVEDAGLRFDKTGRVASDAADPRHTRVGRFLRRLSLDELPQLLNVLNGEMSLVGPRPDLPVALEVDKGRFRGRLEIRPGITGPGQIGGRNSLTLEEKWKLDAAYAETASLLTDFRILARTVFAVIGAEGLYRQAPPPHNPGDED